MRPSAILSRFAIAASALLPCIGVASCGSSATTATSPSNISRCALTIQTSTAQLPAQGGSGSIAVTSARDCTWTAVTEGSWLTVRSGQSGQGDGTVEFTAAANPDPPVRRGAVVLNTQRAEITQAGAPCAIALPSSSAIFGQEGGSGVVQVQASSAQCSWTATTQSDWINLRNAAGSGNGQVAFDVAGTAGPPRTGTITIAGQTFSVTQSQGCSFAITPAAARVSPSGGSGSVSIATGPGCPWTATSNVGWITLSAASGIGPAAVTYAAAATTGPSRTGTANIAGQPFTLTQSEGCSYGVEPSSHSSGAAGGPFTVQVTAERDCPWSAVSDVPWVTVAEGTGRSGTGSVTLTVAATTGPTRSGSATIAGERIAITQSPGCGYTIAPTSASVAAAGGTGRVAVTSAAGCAWTASSSASWLTITSGSSGSGNGEVLYSAAATTGPARTGTLTIGGRTFTLTQGQGCSYSLASTSTTMDDSGGQGTFNVQAAAGCAWTAVSAVPWITVTAPPNGAGTGNGQVRFTVAANSGPPRSGAINAGGRTFTVQQGSGCSFSLSPASQNIPAGGGTGSVGVTAASGCGWTASSNAPWLTIGSGASGTGNGSVGFTAAANPGPARTGTITVGGETFTAMQAGACTFGIAPDNTSVAPAGGTATVTVTAQAGCGWTAVSNAPWIAVAAGASGSGNGSVELTVAASAGASRTGTVTIAGQTFTVSQGSGCTYGIAPTGHTAPAASGSLMVTVTAGASCAWTAVPGVPWLTVPGAAGGTGNGSIQVDIQANAGPARSGTVTIAGQVLTVNQGSGCAYVVAPETVPAPAAGSTPRVDVTTTASCTWTGVSGAPWISVTTGAAGTGTGHVELLVTPNTGPARNGVVTIAGRAVTVSQESGCVYSLSSGSMMIGAVGGLGSVDVMAGAGCGWTAVSNVPWILVSGGQAGSGDGTVLFVVSLNLTGSPRSGTITIGGLTFTVSQE